MTLLGYSPYMDDDKEERISEKIPEEVSGEGETSLGDSDQHSEAPGPHGTGEVYPRGDRPDEGEPEDD